MANTQLRLVQDAQQPTEPTRDPARRVFEHWAWMLGKNLKRTKLGPTRRAAIAAALAMGYDEDTLMLACDGIASHSLDGKPESMQAAMRELEWSLRTEARIERWAELGETFRQRLAVVPVREARPAAPAVDERAELAHRERCRDMARAMRGGGHG